MAGAEVSEWRGSSRAADAATLMVGWVALLWALEVVDVATGHALDSYGIVSRDPSELVDIVPSAFIHFGFGHVAANSLPSWSSASSPHSAASGASWPCRCSSLWWTASASG